MRAAFIGILVLFICDVYALEYFNFSGDIRNFVVGNSKVYVVTDSQLHQMGLDLLQEKSKDLTNDTHANKVNILLPFDANGTLVICGTNNCGYCEVLDINDITINIYREEMMMSVPLGNESSVAFLVDLEKVNGVQYSDRYILVARGTEHLSQQKEYTPPCIFPEAVNVLNTLHSQKGDIFSKLSQEAADAWVTTKEYVEWVDGFQTSSRSHSYLFLNVQSVTPRAMLLRVDNKGKKTEMTRSLKGAKLECCDDKARGKLVASAVISSASTLIWAGIFTAHEDHEDTVLALFNISELENKVPSYFTCSPKCTAEQTDVTLLKPKSVVFKYTSMTSVAAQKIGSWSLLYIGTANGQLIKLVLDQTFRSGCATVLYRSDDDRMLFPRMHFDPVNHKYIYIALGNEIRRVAVTQCGMYSTLRDCRSSLDPLCGWCMNTNKCSTQDECSNSTWMSVPDDYFQKELISFQVANPSGNSVIQLIVTLHLSVEGPGLPPLSCIFKSGHKNPCNSLPTPLFPRCSCSFSSQDLPSEVKANITIGNETFTETLKLQSCPHISDSSPYAKCTACVSAGCDWSSSNQICTWSHGSASQVHIQDKCKDLSVGKNYTPEILSLWPSQVSVHGRNNAVMKGRNLEQVVKIRLRGIMDCNPKETSVLESSSDTLTFHIPSGNKGTVNVCVVIADGSCHSNATITYFSKPTCTGLQPGNTWTSGGREIRVLGTNLEYTDAVSVHSSSKEIILNSTNKFFWFHSYAESEYQTPGPFSVSLRVGNVTVVCAERLYYLPDPEFTSFDISSVDNDVLITIQQKNDRLNLSMKELKVSGLQKEKWVPCSIQEIKSTAVLCMIIGGKMSSIDSLRIEFGKSTSTLGKPQNKNLYILVILIILILLGAIAGVWIHRKSQRKMSARMNDRLELLESEIRNEIRQGFVDLQTEKTDLIENVGAIPFLDYKHFALKIFFPEGGPLASLMVKDLSQNQQANTELDERCQTLSALIQDQMFLTCFVHALEEQKNFNIKDKCTVASLLTVALHSDLPYLTQVMEDLLQSLMDQPSNAQPKLLLRRTESIVEKLLTNWMSICLYGFLRESVGQPLFLLVSALTQQISKGPVDAVTERALYTLNEDWLLWQAQDFNFTPLKLRVLFAVGTEGEVSEPLEVNALTCDTIEQVKEKILQTFQRKFGFSYTKQIRDIDIEYEKEGSYGPLEEVDSSSEVQGEVTMLNTLRHYEIPDGASIKVITKKVHAPLSPQTSLKDDKNFSVKYFHLIDPDIDRDVSQHPEKKKLKLKEIYLTKLLSTKVAVHSFVENLFRSIWGIPHGKAPPAVKYFFDFLDAQAEKKKITDPDVVHIWKTNSLPLRFWVNILKNPNFVFSDLEKTPHLDGCLSVISQAFMDSFSLTDQQLGKHAPTNKLLYAKDIPQYKQEVKTYYKSVRDQSAMSSQEFKAFLHEESKKHQYEFNESAALRELYKYMQRCFAEIEQKLEQKGVSPGLKEKLLHVQELSENMKRSAWL